MSESPRGPAETQALALTGDLAQADLVAPTPDTLLTRSEAARELGTHVSTIRRWERKSVLTPTRRRSPCKRCPRSAPLPAPKRAGAPRAG